MSPASPQAVLEALARFERRVGEPYKPTALGMWACSDAGELWELFERLDLGAYRHLADLGSGDGRAVLLASLLTRATGLEADPSLVATSRGLAQELGLERASFLLGDFRQQDLTDFDLLFIYPDKPLDWLSALLPPAWKGRLLVYGSGLRPPKLELLETLRVGRSLCTLWQA